MSEGKDAAKTTWDKYREEFLNEANEREAVMECIALRGVKSVKEERGIDKS